MTDCCEPLIREHREAERLLDETGDLLSKNRLPEAAEVFARLGRELDAHFLREEQGLFPLLNQYRTMVLMEVEHDDLLAARQAVEKRLSAGIAETGPTGPLAKAFEDFREQLLAHIQEEEAGVFPLAEDRLEPEEKALVRRKYAELTRQFELGRAGLIRPEPGYRIETGNIFIPPEKPVVFHKLFEREHTSLQHIWLAAGRNLARHWAVEHLCLVVIAGRVRLVKGSGEASILTAGNIASINSRSPFALESLEDTHLLLTRVWPRPHLSRV